MKKIEYEILQRCCRKTPPVFTVEIYHFYSSNIQYFYAKEGVRVTHSVLAFHGGSIEA